MAITDAGQICESSATTQTTRMTLSGSVAAGGLMVLYIGGRVASGLTEISSITDSKGHVWDWRDLPSGYRFAGLAFCRATSAMASGSDWIEVRMSKTPEVHWISGHVFTGASGTPTASGSAQGTPGTVASRSVSVSGSDFLVLATVTYAYSSATTTPLNSMTEQDTYDGGNVLVEGLSRNHTSGSSFTAGTTLSSSRYWTVVAVSFPYEAPPTGGRGQPFLIGV